MLHSVFLLQWQFKLIIQFLSLCFLTALLPYAISFPIHEKRMDKLTIKGKLVNDITDGLDIHIGKAMRDTAAIIVEFINNLGIVWYNFLTFYSPPHLIKATANLVDDTVLSSFRWPMKLRAYPFQGRPKGHQRVNGIFTGQTFTIPAQRP